MGKFSEPSGTAEPIDSADATLRQMLRLEDDETHQNTLIDSLCAAARAKVEAHIRQRLIARDVTITEDAFPCDGAIDLGVAPVSDIVSVTYIDAAGSEQTLPESDYVLAVSQLPARIRPAYGKTWPVVRAVPDAVTITATVGFGEDASAVPADILHAIRLYAARLYTYREGVVNDDMQGDLPSSIAAMISHHRVWI